MKNRPTGVEVAVIRMRKGGEGREGKKGGWTVALALMHFVEIPDNKSQVWELVTLTKQDPTHGFVRVQM